MNSIFISKIHINDVRNIHDFEIPISENELKHLIITGKNGSGKTSVLEEIARQNEYSLNLTLSKGDKRLSITSSFLFLFFPAQRLSNFTAYSSQINYNPNVDSNYSDHVYPNFLQHIVDLKLEAIFEKDIGNLAKYNEIEKWFLELEKQISILFQDDTKLEFIRQGSSFSFYLVQKNRSRFTLNEMPAGYNALFSLVAELILRSKHKDFSNKDIEGIVLIDEIETHLHIDLQKKILPFLTSFFPKIQFIVTTHSPFVINSISNAVVCDLEKRIVTEDLSNYSYEAVIESYFGIDMYSEEVKNKINHYEMLSQKEVLTSDESDDFSRLQLYFKDLPKFLSKELQIKIQTIELDYLLKQHA
jgi:predicted ATP-binding protein involved in virulence